MATRILLIRHGETAWNRAKVFRGRHDIPLNENGRRQAGSVAEALKAVPIHAAYTSPLSRSVETAETVLASRGITLRPHEGLIDFDYGEWTGKSEVEVANGWPQEYAAWVERPRTARVPGGETLRAAFERAFGAIEEIARQHDGQTVALFAHRVVNKLLVLGTLGLGLERFPFILQGNCCINEFVRTANGYVIERINDTAHIRLAGNEAVTFDF